MDLQLKWALLIPSLVFHNRFEFECHCRHQEPGKDIQLMAGVFRGTANSIHSDIIIILLCIIILLYRS